MLTGRHPFATVGLDGAPDVPSVLVELGYLSNVKDEELLRDPQWRAKAADRIASAVAQFAAAKVGTGG